MTPKLQTYRIVVCSPNDLLDVRERIQSIIEDINRLLAIQRRIHLEIRRWEKDTPPSMGRPQEVVNQSLQIPDCDIFVGIIWLRFGTPPSADPDKSDSPIESGTEEEFRIAHEAYRAQGSPSIMFYRCTKPPANMSDMDARQLERVERFFSDFAPTGAHPGMVQYYKEMDEFENLFRVNIWDTIHKLDSERSDNTPDLSLNATFQRFGVKELFIPQFNEERNEAKRQALKRANHATLVACSGGSFLGLTGHRFRGHVSELLDRGGCFEAFLLNPWSDTGLAISLAEETDTAVTEKASLGSGNTITGKDAAKLICKSKWYSFKFKSAIKGFQELNDKYGNNIKLNLTQEEIPVTTFLTDKDGFMEPYINVNLAHDRLFFLVTFDIHFDVTSYLYDRSQEYVEQFRHHSMSFDDFLESEEKHKNWFVARMDQLNNSNNTKDI